MNFVFISPQFPRTYWNFCDRLKKNGVNVLGIGDTPYDALPGELKSSLTEYYRLDTLEDYDQMLRAIGFLPSNMERSTGSSLTMNTGWSRTQSSGRIFTSRPACRPTRSAVSRVNQG